MGTVQIKSIWPVSQRVFFDDERFKGEIFPPVFLEFDLNLWFGLLKRGGVKNPRDKTREWRRA